MKSLFFTIISTLFIIVAAFESQANLVVLETTAVQQPAHGEMVSSIACRDRSQNCFVNETDFSSDFMKDFLEGLNPGDVVNMSFGYQRVDDSPLSRNTYEAMVAQGIILDDYIKEYDERETLFRQMFDQNPEVLFVAASGNGQRPNGFPIPGGIPLGPRYKIYPAVFDYKNLITVTSINAESFNPTDRVEYSIAEYANFSSDYVDVAAPVEIDEDGTSFAAPYVSRVSKSINDEVSISASDLKNILQKSCFIQDLDYTLELTKAYKEDSRGSVIGRIQNMHMTHLERRELIDSIKPVMLVKCGGVVSSAAALSCAKTFAEAQGALSVTEACLESQSKEFHLLEGDEEKLKEFWTLQGI